jgi:xanthine dehydrogenase molybdenum-binding subunit
VTWRLGDCDKGFAESDFVFDQTFTTQRVHQSYLEPHACIVAVAADGRIHLWSSNKVPFQTRQYLAAVLEIDPAKILFQLSPVGGDFGGKGSLMDIPLACYLARATGRPIKMVFNSGAYAAFKPNATINLPGARHGAGAYRIPHVAIEALSVYTNTVPSGHMRGPGDPQVYFAVESHTDYIARQLNMDPIKLRRINVLTTGDALPGGHQVDTNTGGNILRRIHLQRKAPRRPRKLLRGTGMGLCLRDIGPGEANIEVGLTPQGKIYILTTVTDTGAGAHTILRQIVAETLGANIKDVDVICGDTDCFDTDIALGGSRVTYLAGKAAAMAAANLRRRIIERAAALWGCSADHIKIAASVLRGPRRSKLPFRGVAANSCARDFPWKERAHFATKERKGTLSYFAQMAEVEIDAETGRLTVLKIVCLNDVGTVINPLQHQGQVEGGIVQGLGFAMMEELADQDGKITTTSLGEYKIPGIKDVPRLETINIYDHAGPGPFQSKPIGENTGTPTAAAIANAIYDATGVQITDLPITSEKIYSALHHRTFRI